MTTKGTKTVNKGLPTINRPSFNVTLPLSKKRGKVYPFTMKQQKSLAIAAQSDNQEEVIDALVGAAADCSSFKPNELGFVDLQYLFLEIRKISVGETIDVELKCSSCGEAHPAKINLNEFKVISPDEKVDAKVMITDDIGIMLKQPNIEMAKTIGDDDTKNIAAVIDYVFDSEDVYKFDDYTDAEISAYIDNLPSKTILDIVAFIENTPKIVLDKDWNCTACGTKNNLHVEGIQGFFM